MDLFPDWLGQYGSDIVGIAGYRIVTGPVTDIQGGPLDEGVLRVRLLSPTIDGTIFVAPVELQVAIEEGAFQVPLVAPGKYDFLVVDQNGTTLWNFQTFLSDETDAAISLAELYLDRDAADCSVSDTGFVPKTFVSLLDTPNSLAGSGGALLVVGDDEGGVQASTRMTWGTGDPEGVVIAAIGNVYIREDGGPGETLYVKESGDQTSAGWVAK